MIVMEEKLFLEVLKDGCWIGFTKQSIISESMRKEALDYLAQTPDRYYYPPYLRGKCRVSFLEV